MEKKHKQIYIYLTFIVTFLIVLLLSCINSNALIDSGNFMSSEGKSLLNQQFLSSYFEGKCSSGEAGCFLHNAGGIGINTVIQTIVDIKLNNQGEMVVESWNTGGGHKVQKVSGNERLATLAATAARNDAAHSVLHALKAATNAGLVVQNGTSSSVQTDISDGSDPNKGKNPPTQNEVKEYKNYKKLTKKATVNPVIKGTTADGEHIIVGPFKMSFGGKGIDKIIIHDTNSGDTDRYDLNSAANSEIRWKAGSNYNAVKDVAFRDWKTISKIDEANNTKFFIILKRKDKWVKDDGTAKLKIKIKQENFKFRPSRIAVCNNNGSAQMGGSYAYDNNEKVIESEEEWVAQGSIEVFGKLKITKEDKAGNQIKGAKYVLYYDSDEKGINDGWLTGTKDAKKGTDASVAGANVQVYSSGNSAELEITKLPLGTYHIFEVEAPSEYSLKVSEHYKDVITVDGKEISPVEKYPEWVYIGARQVTKAHRNKEITPKNGKLGDLKINKKDVDTSEEINGGEFKIYADVSKEAGGNGKLTSGWVKGAEGADKEYVSDINEAQPLGSTNAIKKLAYGTYYIFETKAPEGYDLSEQDGYHKVPENTNIPTPSTEVDWVYLGKQKIVKGIDQQAQYEFNATNKGLGAVQIQKSDYKTKEKLAGAEFKIYADLSVEASGKGRTKSGWLSGDETGVKTYVQDISNAKTYTSTEQGLIDITNLKYGTYYIYETKAPEGYNIKKQDGYKGTSGKGIESAFGEDQDWVYCGFKVVNNSAKVNTIEIPIENKKIIEIEGTVWNDTPNNKANSMNSIWDEIEKTMSGITVNLYEKEEGKETYQIVKSTVTGMKENEDGSYVPADIDGFYNFIKKDVGDDKNIYYSDLENMYIEFVYNNKTIYSAYIDPETGKTIYEEEDKKYVKPGDYGYIAVKEFASDNKAVTSKAIPQIITEPYLDDSKLTGTEGECPGKAVTKEKDLSNYYDVNKYKVLDINLGLCEQVDSEFDIDETLAYVQISMNGYTYTYNYLDTEAIIDTQKEPQVNQPSVYRQRQVGAHFSAALYPSDVAANNLGDANLKVSIIYQIKVKNNQTVHVDEIYKENGLHLTSLTNYYRSELYELETNKEEGAVADWSLWSTDEEENAVYNLSSENSVFKDAIPEQGEKETYIKFNVKDDVVKDMIDGFTEEEGERFFNSKASKATGTGYHEYLRTDSVWNESDSAKAYSEATDKTELHAENGDLYFRHKTVEKTYDSPALYMKFYLGETRKLSGTVFEDTDIPEDQENDSESGNSNLGNGILDDTEENRVEKVKVELLDVTSLWSKADEQWNYEELQPAKLYPVDKSSGRPIVIKNPDGTLPLATTETDAEGKYEFDGLVPGYYILRFTYGDGTQRLSVAGNNVYSMDYRSTIITDQTVENAMETSISELKNIRTQYPASTDEELRKKVEWYKYMNEDNIYSIATDSISQRLITEKYVYNNDGTVTVVNPDGTTKTIFKYESDGTIVDLDENDEYKLLINSYTPMTSISIENDVDDEGEGDNHVTTYERFNFGIIGESKTEMKLEKAITNVKFTNQTGGTIINENPQKSTSPYLADLETVGNSGSRYARLELEANLIYGSELATTYQITVTNTEGSDIDWIENEEDKVGYYFKYGKKSNDATYSLKKVKVKEVVDHIDNKYDFASLTSKEKETFIDYANDDATTSRFDTNETPEKIEITIKEDTPASRYLSITGWSDIVRRESVATSYTVTSLLSQEDDTSYTNGAEIKSLSLDKLSTLKSSFKWEECQDDTLVAVYSSTGADKRSTYWVTAAIGLIVIVAGVVLLKKKVLK